MNKFIFISLFLSLFFFDSCGGPDKNKGTEGGLEDFPILNPAQTSLSIVPSPTSVKINEPVTFTAYLQVVNSFQTRPPKGAITFLIDGEKACLSVPLDSVFLTASCTSSFTTQGLHLIEAIYGEDELAYTSSSISINYNVEKLQTSITLQGVHAIEVGDTLNLIATVTNSAPTNYPPDGAVEFKDLIGQESIPVKCNQRQSKRTFTQNTSVVTCQYTVTTGTDAAHILTATYLGNASNEKVSTSSDFYVNKILPGIDIKFSKINDDPVNNIKVSAQLNRDSSFDSTGTLEISSDMDSHTCKIEIHNTKDILTCDYKAPLIETVSYTATYTSQNDFFKSNSRTAANNLGKIDPGLSLESTSSIQIGEKLLLTAKLDTKDGPKAPEHGISFRLVKEGQNTESIGCENIALNESHIATCHFLTNSVPVGNYRFIAIFMADDNYNGKSSNEISAEIKAREPHFSLETSLSASNYDLTVNAILTAEGTLPLPAPLGEIYFSLNGSNYSNCSPQSLNVSTDKSSIATCTMSLSSKQNTILASYAPKPEPGYPFLAKTAQTSFSIPAERIQKPTVSLITQRIVDNIYVMNHIPPFEFQVQGKWFLDDIKEIYHNIHMEIVSARLNEDYVFRKKDDVIEEPEIKGECGTPILHPELNNTIVFKCNFVPYAAKMTLNYNLKYESGGQTFDHMEGSFDIDIRQPAADMTKFNITDKLSPPAGCGLSGNTEERILDCSMKVANFGGRVLEGNEHKFFLSTNQSENWFLVSCPAGGQPYQCAWLSPELNLNNPVTQNGEYISFDPSMPMNTPQLSMKYYAVESGDDRRHRILWSGMLKETYKFWQANLYTGYEYADFDVLSGSHGDYDRIKNVLQTFRSIQKDDDTKYTSYTDICIEAIKGNVESGGIWLPRDGYDFHMPSYPQIMTLTGAPDCNSGKKAYECLDLNPSKEYKWPYGFSSRFVPGFYRDSGGGYRFLWSSGWLTRRQNDTLGRIDRHGWALNQDKGNVSNYDRNQDSHGIRCASMEW